MSKDWDINDVLGCLEQQIAQKAFTNAADIENYALTFEWHLTQLCQQTAQQELTTYSTTMTYNGLLIVFVTTLQISQME